MILPALAYQLGKSAASFGHESSLTLSLSGCHPSDWLSFFWSDFVFISRRLLKTLVMASIVSCRGEAGFDLWLFGVGVVACRGSCVLIGERSPSVLGSGLADDMRMYSQHVGDCHSSPHCSHGSHSSSF